jgi:MFS family permease
MLPLFVLAHLMHHLLTALPTPLLPFIRDDFSLNYTQSSLVITAFSMAYGIGQLPAGWLADRIGPRLLITVGIFGVAIVGVFVGLSQTYVLMLVFMVIMGLAAGGYHPAATPLIISYVEPNKRGRALGIHLLGGGGSFFLAPIIAGAIAAAWGWRASFLGLAIPTAIFGIVFYILLGKWSVSRQQARQSLSGRAPGLELPKDPLLPLLPRTKEFIVKNRILISFISLTVLTAGLTSSVLSFVPLYMVDHFHVSGQVAASMIAVAYLPGLFVGPIAGYFSDRMGKIPLLLAISVIVGLAVYLLKIASFGLGIGALLFLLGVTNYSRMPIAENYIIGKTPERHRSTIYGVYYCGSQESGAIFAPVIGVIADHFGFQASLTFAALFVLAITVICGLLLWGSRD